MSKTTLLSIAIGVLLLMNVGLMTFIFLAKPPQEAANLPMRRPEGPKQLIIDRLHFDPQQVAQYEELIHAHRAAIRSLEAEIRHTKNSLYNTLSDSLHTGKDSLQNKLGSLQRDIETVHYNHFEDIRRLCHPGQLADFASLTHDLAGYFAPENNGPMPKDR